MHLTSVLHYVQANSGFATSQSHSKSAQVPCLTAEDVFSYLENSQVLLEEIRDASLNICQEAALLADMENRNLSNIRKIVASQIKEFPLQSVPVKTNRISCGCFGSCE